MKEADGTALTNGWFYPAHTDPGDHFSASGRQCGLQTGRMTHGVLSQHAIAALLICAAVWTLATNDRPDAFVWGFAVPWFTVMALQLSASNRRDMWHPAGEYALSRSRARGTPPCSVCSLYVPCT